MKTLVIFYSYGGNTRKLAQALAEEQEATLVEVRELHRHSVPGAFVFGAVRAMRQQRERIMPLKLDFTPYDRIVIMAPIWASHPAPPANNIFDMLPAGKELDLRMVSSGGKSAKETIVAMAERTGSKVVHYQDIATAKAK